MASQNIARLGVVLAMDTAEFTASIDKAISENKKLKASIQRESNAAAKEIVALKYATEDYGKSLTKVELMQREVTTGKFRNAAESLKNELLKQAAAYDQVAASAKKAQLASIGMLGSSRDGKLNPQQVSALGYQTTDIITGLAGGQNPLLVLIQQGGQLRDQFGGFIPLFKGIASVFTLTRVAVGGLVAVFGSLAYLAYKGSEDFKEFKNSLALTNNVLGMTSDAARRFNDELAQRMNVSVSDAKDILMQLIKSGKFSAESMDSVAKVIANVAKLSGEAADQVAKNLIPSFNGSAASAKSLNDQYNFLTEAQYKQIEALDLAGKKQDAIKLTADLLNKSLDKQKENLQITEGWWVKLTRSLSDFIEKFKQLGAETEDDKLRKLSEKIEDYATLNILGFKIEATALKKEKEAAIKEYLDYWNTLVKKRQAIYDNAAKQQKENQAIADWEYAGGEKKRQEIIASTKKIYADLEFQQKVANATEFQRIDYEAERDKQQALNDLVKSNIDTRYQYAKAYAEQYSAKILDIEAKAEQRKLEISRQAAEEVRKEQQTRLDSVETETTKLKIYEDNLMISEKDYKIALNRLEAEQKIAEIVKKTKLSPEAKEEAIAREREIERRANELATLQEKLGMLRDVNSAVFKNMEDAITKFVKTGKFAFKDFAASVIQDILAIYLKAQMLALFNQGKNIFSSIFGGGTTASFDYAGEFGSNPFGLPGLATGGMIIGPSIVGENGPELFIPQTSGTIVPNQQLSSYGDMQPQVVYNGPYIENMSAIDTQSAAQFLAKNKSAVWAANQSASRSMPQSR